MGKVEVAHVAELEQVEMSAGSGEMIMRRHRVPVLALVRVGAALHNDRDDAQGDREFLLNRGQRPSRWREKVGRIFERAMYEKRLERTPIYAFSLGADRWPVASRLARGLPDGVVATIVLHVFPSFFRPQGVGAP